MRKYTQKEYEDAVKLLKQRIENEQSMTSDVERLLEAYAGFLLHALYTGASDADIELLIEDLVMQIMDDCRMLAIDEHDVDDDTIALVFEGDETSVEERVRRRAVTFLDEVESAFKAGSVLQKGETEVLNTIKESMDDPWDNELLSEVRGMVERGEASGNIEDYEERHYGKGVPISSRLDIELITVSAVAETWNEWEWKSASNDGAIGYYVERGSSYPCDTCNSHTGVFHPITDKSHLPQYHRNCRCFVVYVYDDKTI